MNKEYTLMESEQYRLILLVNNTDFDYYTDICVELNFDGKRILLLKDNLLYLKNVFDKCEKKVNILDKNLDERNLGLLLNEYYYYLYEEQEKYTIILDEQGQWIGEKYICFSNLEYSTWIYRYDGDIVLKVTPIFYGFEKDDYLEEYEKFVQEYNDVFRIAISTKQIKNAAALIDNLYSSLI